MAILSLPIETLLLISRYLQRHDFNSFLQSHTSLYHMLNDELYRDNVRNHDGSALFWAASSGSLKTLQRLLASGANVRWSSTYQWTEDRDKERQRGWLPHQFYKWEEQQKHRPPAKEHPISIAVVNGHVEIVTKFIELGVDPDYKDPTGRSPLSLATHEGHLALTQMFVTKGADLSSLDDDRMCPIDHAATQGHQEVVNFLFQEARRLVDRKHPSEELVLQRHFHWVLKYAAERGDDKRLEYLLAQDGADLNYIPLQRNLVPQGGSWYPAPWPTHTPLICTLQTAPNPISTAKILLDHGADPNILTAIKNPSPKWPNGGLYENAVSAALGRDQSYNLIELLLKHDLNQSNSEMTLFKAMYLKKTAEFQLLVENGANYLRIARQIWEYAYQPILYFLTERGIHSEVSSPLRTVSDWESFDFEVFLNPPPINLDYPRPPPPPQTIAPWAYYLTKVMYDHNPFCENDTHYMMNFGPSDIPYVT
jgi:ankyrin repeat protein